MAKSQKKSNREIRKPKQDKPKAAAATVTTTHNALERPSGAAAKRSGR